MKLLFVSTPVGALGSGLGGGVELTIRNAAQALRRRGHQICVIAPAGSTLDVAPLRQVQGSLQIPAQNQNRSTPITMPAGSVLAAMWEQARLLQQGYDAIVNFAYDWLPLYLTPFLQTPVVHLISMSSLSESMDETIEALARTYPNSVAMHTAAQAQTFSFPELCRIIGNGLDLNLYPFNASPEPRLCWIGRIAPEKGLEDAAAAAQVTGIPLDICGSMQDEEYWLRILREFPDAPLHYQGFLDTAGMARVVRGSRALLMTPKWVEAFGNVAMEALACGTPVISYRRGGPAELIEDGRTGLLVEPDSVEGLCAAIARIDTLDRRACRLQAERDYSLAALGMRFEQWIAEAIPSFHEAASRAMQPAGRG